MVNLYQHSDRSSLHKSKSHSLKEKKSIYVFSDKIVRQTTIYDFYAPFVCVGGGRGVFKGYTWGSKVKFVASTIIIYKVDEVEVCVRVETLCFSYMTLTRTWAKAGRYWRPWQCGRVDLSTTVLTVLGSNTNRAKFIIQLFLFSHHFIINA